MKLKGDEIDIANIITDPEFHLDSLDIFHSCSRIKFNLLTLQFNLKRNKKITQHPSMIEIKQSIKTLTNFSF